MRQNRTLEANGLFGSLVLQAPSLPNCTTGGAILFPARDRSIGEWT
jgi:hypothetical protein